ncbi:hypothetical protein OHA37_31240 [Streptomyces sp. NBC_00335]|uniref:hypothetical protein n=1 Tax=unclassified Streptomyces TaxID=2593676 RepID=UPI0022584F6C|nr:MULTISPECIES: hypothetical protein [unclassified Streptomyces]MCX5408326.1 hypothetical protein [Streptomyces sp. NBC_00086]
MPHSPAEPAPSTPTPAHHRARPVHWLATASALAAVIAGAGLLQPAPATGASAQPVRPATPASPQSPVSGPEAAAPDAHAVAYPLDCKGAPQAVTATAEGDLDGDGRPETVAAVRCDAGSGTPPHAIYVLAQDTAKAAKPRVVATLLEAGRKQTATDLTIRDGLVTATLLGYSSPEVPRYSPDTEQLAKWRWTGGKFRQELTDSTPTGV